MVYKFGERLNVASKRTINELSHDRPNDIFFDTISCDYFVITFSCVCVSFGGGFDKVNGYSFGFLFIVNCRMV